jgi:hypothetical protein
MGYAPSFLLVRAAFRMATEDPPVLGGLVLAAGYFAARVRRAPQIDDRAAVDLLRAEQRQRLRGLLRGSVRTAPDPIPDLGPAFWLEETESS